MNVTKNQIKKIVNEVMLKKRLHESMHDRALNDMSGVMLEVIFSMQEAGLNDADIIEKLHGWIDTLVADGYEGDDEVTLNQFM